MEKIKVGGVHQWSTFMFLTTLVAWPDSNVLSQRTVVYCMGNEQAQAWARKDVWLALVVTWTYLYIDNLYVPAFEDIFRVCLSIFVQVECLVHKCQSCSQDKYRISRSHYSMRIFETSLVAGAIPHLQHKRQFHKQLFNRNNICGEQKLAS